MTTFRRLVLVLAMAQTALAALIALVGSFADGGTLSQRLVLVVLHPLAALSLLFLVSVPRPGAVVVLVVACLLTATVAVDAYLAWTIAQGAVKGDWELPIALAVVPAIGAVYALVLLRQSRATGG